MSQSVPGLERESISRLLCSLVISCVCCAAASYGFAARGCPGIIVPPQQLLRVDLPDEGRIIGMLLLGAFFVSLILYDLVSGVRYLCGLDSQLNDIKFRPGHGGSWRGAPPAPLPIEVKFIVYPCMLMVAIFWPITNCRR